MTQGIRRLPVMVGIAGPSASAKTTLASHLEKVLGDLSSVHICQDDYYRDLTQLPLRARSQRNFDSPDALEIDLFVHHLRQLRRGCPIHKPRYDFTKHRRLPDPELVYPASVIVVEGTLVLAIEPVRNELQLKVYLDAPLHVCLQRRIDRDVRRRGRAAESVVRQFTKTVRPMHEKFVIPSRQYADIEVSYDNIRYGAHRIASRLLVHNYTAS